MGDHVSRKQFQQSKRWFYGWVPVKNYTIYIKNYFPWFWTPYWQYILWLFFILHPWNRKWPNFLDKNWCNHERWVNNSLWCKTNTTTIKCHTPCWFFQGARHWQCILKMLPRCVIMLSEAQDWYHDNNQSTSLHYGKTRLLWYIFLVPKLCRMVPFQWDRNIILLRKCGTYLDKTNTCVHNPICHRTSSSLSIWHQYYWSNLFGYVYPFRFYC